MTTILFVEDESPIRDMVRFALARSGMEMIDAADAREAETRLETQRPDLILLDWMLPEESGISLLRRLRQDPQKRDIPVIMLTAMAGEEEKIRGLEVGADDYVTKPFSPPELIARIKAVLRRATGADQQGRLHLGGLTLDPAAHEVRWKGEPVPLGPTEYRLLNFLLAHAGRVYSRGQLLDYVWPADEAREERTVDVSIRRLRKALEPFGMDRHIETVRGAGYRLKSADSGGA
ncbi:MAG TPA: phosphate regulon transcriptional regulatory protein PhoB [Chromatiaceae bacterium]|nr:phosphate regulon transcriptional regulatory protein PhoB [Chromatiaceae bacterium]